MNPFYLLYYKKDNKIRQVKRNNVLDDLYELKATIPNLSQINDYIERGTDKQIKKNLQSDKPQNIIDKIKSLISEIDNKIPLYDAYKKNLLMVCKENVYERVIYQSYRFPNKSLILTLKNRQKELKKLLKTTDVGEFNATLKKHINNEKGIKYGIIHQKINLQDEYHKLELMLSFLKSFNIRVLESTYMKTFYLYANEVGKNITVCFRPSFMAYYSHLNPYYTRSELINMALNMELIKPSNKFYDQNKVMNLCYAVNKNDISANTIIKHQEYIISENKIGLVQYYSLQGSYFMNQYLRGLIGYDFKNELLERIITSTWELILGAPEFDKEYILYRFIHDDSYLKHLNVGDEFIESGFISTTRDPFYKSETYKFGFILIKIRIPANIKGVGLCFESYSHFPEEQEIVLPPLSVLKLIKKDSNALYYHTDDNFASKVNTRYEFEYVGSKHMKMVDRPKLTAIYEYIQIVDFLKIQKHTSLTIYEKIKKFISEYVNEIFQFKTKIGNNEYDLITEWYDSTNAYKKFYASTLNNGFSIYTIVNNNITFFIELGENNNVPYMYVNYYFKYASASKCSGITDTDFIKFLSTIAYYFDIKHVILYAEYTTCDIKTAHCNENNKNNEDGELDMQIHKGGNYCIDFYRYFKYNEKRFYNKNIRIDTTELKPFFSYYELDRLKTVSPNVILQKEDRDEIYQLYNKTYKLYKKGNYNIADFYVWIIENYCAYLKIFINKMHRVYSANNPFKLDFYILDPNRYLYNKNLIYDYPNETNYVDDIYPANISIDNRIPKNEYRTAPFERQRVPTGL